MHVSSVTWLKKSTRISDCCTFISDSIGWEIVEIRIMRGKLGFCLRIFFEKRLVKNVLREMKFVSSKMHQQ